MAIAVSRSGLEVNQSQQSPYVWQREGVNSIENLLCPSEDALRQIETAGNISKST
jgi:hypothetical protein